MRTLKLILAPALLLGALALPAVANTAPAPAPAVENPGMQMCKDNPQKCEEMKARREAFCKNNPQTCESRKEARQARRKWCEQNPDKCQKLKDEQAQRQERAQERRDAAPAGGEKPAGPPR